MVFTYECMYRGAAVVGISLPDLHSVFKVKDCYFKVSVNAVDVCGDYGILRGTVRTDAAVGFGAVSPVEHIGGRGDIYLLHAFCAAGFFPAVPVPCISSFRI